MQRNSEIENKKLWGVLFIIFIAIALQSLKGETVLSDPFHYGEYFASAVVFFTKHLVDFQPLTIHGALDFIPALVARNIWGAENYFLPTSFLYELTNIFSSILLVAITFELMKDKAHRLMILMSIGISAFFLVGYRDVALLVSLYLFIISTRWSLNAALDKIILIAFGIVVAFALFWSFDRGIAGATSLGLATMFMAFKNKKYLIPLLSFLVSISLIFAFSKIFSLGNYIENIRVLLDTSSQWSYGWRREYVILSLFAIFFNVIVISFVFETCWRNKSFSARLPDLIAFTLLSIFMLKIGINRADSGHIYMSLWAPMLGLFCFYDERILANKLTKAFVILLFAISLLFSIRVRMFVPALITGTVIYLVTFNSKELNTKFTKLLYSALIGLSLFYILLSSAKDFYGDKYQWLRVVSSPPNNASSSIEGIRWVADRLLQSKANCIFDLANNGVINGLTSLPSCSRFTYPVYAGPKYEMELIDAVRIKSPEAIVYSSTYWSYSIDGKTMRDRFPALDVYLLKQYPTMECSNGYCIRYKND